MNTNMPVAVTQDPADSGRWLISATIDTAAASAAVVDRARAMWPEIQDLVARGITRGSAPSVVAAEIAALLSVSDPV